MHIVTGLGRSGTTFIAEILKNCGFDMGSYYNDIVKGGYEHPDGTKINKKILNGDFWGCESDIAEMHRIADSFDIIKDPRFIVTIGHWLQYDVKIGSIFLCQRDIDQVLDSALKSNAGTMSIFNGLPRENQKVIADNILQGFIHLCQRNDIELYAINYPKSISDFNQVKCLSKVVNDVTTLKSAWEQCRDISKNNYSKSVSAEVIHLNDNRNLTEALGLARTIDLSAFDSYDHYKTYCHSDAVDIEANRRRVENAHMKASLKFRVPGFCWVCRKEGEFLVDDKYHKGTSDKIRINWKERLECQSCGMNNRKRSSIHVFNKLFHPSKNARIFISEQLSSVFKWFQKNYENTIGSEYLGASIKNGAMDAKGIRNEDLTKLTFNDNRFDYVIGLDVFEHIPNYVDALKECRRVLSQDGFLFFTVPFFKDLQDSITRATIDSLNNVKHILPPDYHGNPLDPQGSLCYTNFGWNLLSVLRDVGFHDIKAYSYWSEYFGYLGDNLFVFTAKAGRNSSTPIKTTDDTIIAATNQPLTVSAPCHHDSETEKAHAPLIQCSIIIPVHNKLTYTQNCLDSLFRNNENIDFETIAIDNASSDETSAYLEQLGDRVRVLSNEHNAGFVDACNQGARHARGENLIFLNNDTVLPDHWITPLLDAVELYPHAGAAGAKLIYPDGRLQEAGAVVFSDGTAKNYGRGDDPNAPAYNQISEVDYCSGACFLVRRDLFLKLGGFDERYAPAYYEETDFCFQLRASGYRVLYVPHSEIVHHGSVTAGHDDTSGFRKYLVLNREKFVHKWKTVLNKHEPPLKADESLYTADRRLLGLRKSRLLMSIPTGSINASLDSDNQTELRASLYNGIQTHLLQGRESDALMGLRDLINFAPDFALAHNDMGVLQYRHGNLMKALSCYRSAASLAPNNITFRKNLADLLWIQLNRTEEALKEYLLVLETDPKDIEALLALGHISLKNRQVQDAEYFFYRVLEIDPGNRPAAEALNDLAMGPIDAAGVAAASTSSRVPSQRMVVVSHHLPRFDRGSADFRNFQILEQFLHDGWEILYLYRSEVSNPERYMNAYNGRIAFRKLEWIAPVYMDHITTFKPAVVWITSLWTLPYAEFVDSLIKTISARKSFKLVLDTMDFHAKKYERKFEHSKAPDDFHISTCFKSIEESIYPAADWVVTVSTTEALDIKKAIPNCAPLATVPNIHPIKNDPSPLAGRNHICFLGNFTVNHNIDAARYFISDIFPCIQHERNDIQFHLIGFASDQLTAFGDHEAVRLIGPVDDLGATLDRYRLFVCPMTYGAGMKGKVGMAMANGLPIVSTSIGMEGFPVIDGQECIITDDPKIFATRCLELLRDDIKWLHFQSAGRQFIVEHLNGHDLSNQLLKVLSGSSQTLTAQDRAETISKKDLEPQSIELISNNNRLLTRQLEQIRSAKFVRSGARPLFDSNELHISWILTRRCNYDCSYCNAHDNQDGNFPSLKALKMAVDNIARIEDRAISFGLAGGEPTIHPHFVEILLYITQRLSSSLRVINTTTNLSLPNKFFRDLIDEVGETRSKLRFVASYHFEFAKEERFIRNTELLASNGIPITIALMAHPEKMTAVKHLYSKLNNINSTQINFRVVPIRENYGVVLDSRYSQKAAEWLRQLDSKNQDGQIILDFYSDGKLQRLPLSSAMELTTFGLNSFKGMYCNAGVNHLSIDERGFIAPAVCFRKQHNTDRNIYSGGFTFDPQPVICPFERCGCNSDLRIPKYLVHYDALNYNLIPHHRVGYAQETSLSPASTPEPFLPEADEISHRYNALIASCAGKSSDKVEPCLREFISSYPGHAAAHNDLAIMCNLNGNYKEATANFNRALEIEPENLIFQKNQADFLYFIRGDAKTAMKTYRRLYQKFPEDTEIQFCLARIYLDGGKIGDARSLLKNILRLDPGHQAASSALEDLSNQSEPASFNDETVSLKPVCLPIDFFTTRLHGHGWTHKEDLYLNYLETIELLKTVSDPAISIVCISWRLDPDTVENFKRLQKERHLNFELIFVDNGGQTEEFAELKPLVDLYVRLNANTGAYLARNIGAVCASAPLLFFLEDDGLPAEDLIKNHLEAFRRYDIISVRGVYLPKSPTNPFNAMARHYYLGERPFPHFVNLEGNASYDAKSFFTVGGWDDRIRFGHGGPELAYRLLQYDPDYGKQIYSPGPIIYHDYADNENHLIGKRNKQTKSLGRLAQKYPDFDAFLSSWSNLYRQEDLIPLCEDMPNGDRRAPVDPSSSCVVVVNHPSVSIVIPTFNRSEFLQTALESALNQSHPANEIIVVDDASTDATADVVSGMTSGKVRYVRKQHSGAPGTRNRGIAEAHSDYILWLDDDDILLPNALESHLETLKRAPHADVVYGVLQNFDSASDQDIDRFNPNDWELYPDMLLSSMIKGCALPNPGTLVRRSVYDRKGGYDPQFSRAHDYEFWGRSLTELQFKKNYSIVCRYRMHGNNMSRGDFIDRSFESVIVRRMLRKYGLKRIYHWLNWDKPNAARTVALYMAAESLLSIDDTHNALALLDQIPSNLQTVDIQTLKVRGLIKQGKNQLALDLLASLQGSNAMTAGQLKALNKIVLDFHAQTRRLQKAIRRSERKQIMRYLQTLEDNAQDVTPDQILALIALDPDAVSDRQKLRMLQTAVMLDPENSVLRTRAGHMLPSEDDRQELAATCRRVLSQSDRNENLKRSSTKISSASSRSVDISAGTSCKAAVSVSIIMPYFGTQTALTQIISQLAANPDVSYEFFLITADRFKKKTPAWFKTSMGANITLSPLPVVSGNQPTTTDFNQALKQSNGRYIVLLQQPMRIGSRWLKATRLLDKQGKGWGLASPVVCGTAGLLAPPDFLTTGSFANRSAALFAQRPHRRFFPTGISSPCTIISRHLWHTMGSLRPGIKNPLTAVTDYSLRANQGGYRNVIFGDILAEDFQIRPSHKRRRQRKRTRKHFPLDAKAFSADASAENDIGNDQLTYRDTIEGIANAFHNDRLDVAVNIYQAAATQFPKMPNLKEWMAEHLVIRGQARAALEVLGDIAPSTARPDQLALYASALENNGQYEQAAEWTERLLAQHPDHAVGLDLRGVLAFRQDDHTKAEACFTAAIESDPSGYRAYNHLATLIWSKGDKAEALRHFRQAFIINPADPSIAADLHTAALAQDDIRATYRLFAEAHQYFPENRQLLFLLIDLLLKLEEYQPAMDFIEAAIVRFGLIDGLLEAAQSIRDRIGPYSGHGAHPKDRVSLCMIAKDEAAHLPRCLHSLKPVVDEIILVDTGSNDATREIATVFGAKVIEFDWCDDFAAARNFGIDHAEGQWILVMDADEIISLRDHNSFRKLVRSHRSKAVAFSIVTRNYTRQCNLIGWQANDGKYPGEEAGAGWTPSEKVRLFPNDPHLRFEYPVHEVVRPALERSKIRTLPCVVPVHHYGYLDHEKAACKGEAYYRIGMQKLHAMAHDPLALRELAVQAGQLGHHGKAVDLWHRFLKIEPGNARAHINLSTAYGRINHFHKAREYARKAMRLEPDLREAHLNAALAELFLGRAAEAAKLLKPLVLKHHNYFSAIFMLGCAYICSGHIPKGLDTLSKLERTPLWPTISVSIDEIMLGLTNAGRKNDAERIGLAIDELNLPELPLDSDGGVPSTPCSMSN